MGILNFLTGGRARGGSFGSSNAIATTGNYDRVLTPTTPAAITPVNPGNFSSIRTAPILTAPRYFSQGEAQSIRQLATEKRQQLAPTRSAYKGLKQLAKADAEVHSLHRDYETTEGKAETKKKRADVRHAKAMVSLTPAYAGMAQSMQLAAERASIQIQSDQQQRLARHAQTRARLQGVR